MNPPLYRVVDWDKNFENHRSRDRKKLNWVPVPNRHDGDGYTELVDHECGAAHLGGWIAIVQIASKSDPRGTLIRSGGIPHDADSLRRMSKLPRELFDELLPRLKNIGWLEVIDNAALPENPAVSGARAPDQRHNVPPNGMEGNGREGNGKPIRGTGKRIHVRSDVVVFDPEIHPIDMLMSITREKRGERAEQYYCRMLDKIGDEYFRKCVSELNHEMDAGDHIKNPGAIFTNKLKQMAAALACETVGT